jgi:hypothetical protein
MDRFFTFLQGLDQGGAVKVSGGFAGDDAYLLDELTP